MDVKSMSRDAILEWVAEFEEAGFKLASESEDRIEIEHERGSVIATWNGSAWELSGENAAARDALMKVVSRVIARSAGEDVPQQVRNGKKSNGSNTGSITPYVHKIPPMPHPADESEFDITLDDIKRYICPDASDKEAYIFFRLCQAARLNPFRREAYLIKYGDKPATVVVGKEAFTRKAEKNPAFDGCQAGIIVLSKDGRIERREGTFKLRDEQLLGGWAKVFRKDRSHPFVAEVSLEEYAKSTPSWQQMPATMIRKVALVQALREAFPSDLGGLYDEAEVAV